MALIGCAGGDTAALRMVAARDDAALCTIVGIDGSFSRRRGAQLAIAPDSTRAGDLADHCLEAELTRQAAHAAGPVVLRYGQGSPFLDFRLPCGSGLDILVDPAPDRSAAAAAVAALDARREAVLTLPAGPMAARSYAPPLRIQAFGDGADARALAMLADAAGVAITIHGPDTGLTMGRAPTAVQSDAWTAILLLFHDHEWEAAILDWALRTPALIIGAIGGAKARIARTARLRADGVPDHAIARLRSPVGAIPMARDAGTLALGLLAEAVAAYEAARA